MTFFKLVLTILLSSSFAFAGGGVESGGGGGTSHDLFINAGQRVLFYLANNPKGKALVVKYKLDLCRLRQTLDEDLVFVYEDEKSMTDARGSVVDAYTYRWRIHLANKVWSEYFEKNEDIYFLVFKEMLRSESRNFSDAGLISQNLKPFPRELFLDRELTGLSEKSDSSCLSDADLAAIEEVKKSHRLFQRELPACVSSKSLDQTKVAADQLIDLARKSECRFEPIPCGLAEDRVLMNDTMVFIRSVFWRGQRIFSVPFSTKNLKTNEVVNMSAPHFERILEEKLAELEYYKVCSSTGRVWQSSPKDQGSIVDLFSMFGMTELPFEYLRKGVGKLCQGKCLTDQYLGIVGVGSKFELLERGVHFNGNVSFLKVRMLTNSIVKIQKGHLLFANGRDVPLNPGFSPSLAKVGDIGYVTMSSTDLLGFYHEGSGQILLR